MLLVADPDRDVAVPGIAAAVPDFGDEDLAPFTKG